MSYTNLINTNLTSAFNLVKDLAVPATFTKTVSNSYNFGTATASSTTTSLSTKVITLSNEKRSSNTNVVKKELMFKTSDIGDIKAFDSVTISSVAWKIGQVIQDSGFITIVEVYREV